MEIFPGIHCLPITTNTLPPHRTTNTYVVAGSSSALVIDAICPDSLGVYENLFKDSRTSISAAAITHPHVDHYLGLAKPLVRFGGKIICHSGTRTHLKQIFADESFGEDLKGGEVLKAGDYTIRVFHTPGHSPGHICLYLEEEKILFSGDTILGFGTSIISPPEGDMAAYMQTLEVLSRLDIHFIFPGHGPIIEKRASERIRWYITHRKIREKLILEALSGSLLTPCEIAEKIYSEEDFKMHGRDLLPRAARTVMAHLVKLEKENRVYSLNKYGSTLYGLV